MPVLTTKKEKYINSVIIIGFKLYPKCIIKLDKTFTSIFGKNGVGKTTLLDAVQMALIANQSYTKFNITTQKDDRSISDYMQDTAAYIVFNTNEHIAFGIRLLKNPDMKVDIRPFAIENSSLVPDDFILDTRLLDNIQELKKMLLIKYPSMEFRDFQTISEYHQYLYDKGILAINISERISEFSTLYRSISTGILKQGKKMIKDVLSVDDANPKKLIVALNTSIKQRSHIVRKIAEIKQIKEEIANLEMATQKYYDNAFKYFSNQLNIYNARLSSAKSEIIATEELIEKQNTEIETIKHQLDLKEAEKNDIEEERDKLLVNISDFEKNYRAFEQYSFTKDALSALEQTLDEKLANAISLKDILDQKILSYDRLNETFNELKIEKARIEGDLKAILIHYNNYNELQKNLTLFCNTTKEKIDNAMSLDRTLRYWEGMAKDIENLHFHKKELEILSNNLKIHKRATALRDKLKGANYNVTDKNQLISIITALENRSFNIKKEKDNLKSDIDIKNREIDELLKGKIVLPEALKDFEGDFLFRCYDDTPIEKSAETEAILGDLKYAAIINDEKDISRFAKGSDKLYFILKDSIDENDFLLKETDNGYLIKNKRLPAVTRYEPKPKYPIIGEKSRKQRIDGLLNEIKRAEEQISIIDQELSSINHTIKDLQELSHIYDYLEFIHLEEELVQKQRLIELIEEKSFIYNKIKDYLHSIQRLKSYFERKDYVDEHTRLTDRLKAVKKEIEHTALELKELKEDIDRLKKSYLSFEADVEELKRKKYEFDATIKQLESEYPIDILTGKVDFTEGKKLQEQANQLKDNLLHINRQIDQLKDKKREVTSLQEKYIEKIKIAKSNIEIYEKKLEELQIEISKLFAEDVLPQQYDISDRDYYETKGVFEKELDTFLKKHDKKPSLSNRIMEQFQDAVIKVFPNFNSLSKLEADLEALNLQLIRIEDEIKAVIGNFKMGIEQNIYRIKNALRKLNGDLTAIRFGRIRQIKLRVEEREAYHKLQQIHQTDSIMSLLESDNVDFEEFIKVLGKSLGYNRTQVTEDDVLNYKNYFDIEIDLFDDAGNIRTRGLSNGENLGTNIVVVLSMLTRLSEESLSNKILPIVLDEADRLDADSINTLYEIAQNWGVQLIVALPNIPNFNKGLHYHLIANERGIVMPHVRYE